MSFIIVCKKIYLSFLEKLENNMESNLEINAIKNSLGLLCDEFWDWMIG